MRGSLKLLHSTFEKLLEIHLNILSDSQKKVQYNIPWWMLLSNYMNTTHRNISVIPSINQNALALQ